MSDNEPQQVIQQISEPKYIVEVKHMKSGSALVLAINKLRVSGDDLNEVMADMKAALGEYLTETGE
jgi:flagellar basal body P-ring protein FlgI